VNRSELQASFELRPPALVRDFKAPALERLFDSQLRHTIEPETQTSAHPGTTNNSQMSTTKKMPKTTVLEDLLCAVVPSPLVGPPDKLMTT
jgi:hypothetical protein